MTDENGVRSKPRDGGDHTIGNFLKRGWPRGWARIERKVVLLFRTDAALLVPRAVLLYYVGRYPNKIITDRATMNDRVDAAVYLNREERVSGHE